MAFVCIARMDYQQANRLLDSIYDISDNQIELLIADIQHMRLCQRQAQNKSFYEYKEKARKRISRINEERETLSERQEKRLTYAETELAFVVSTYYYYVGLSNQSIDAIKSVNREGLMQKDTAQYLSLLYQVGSGGIIVASKNTEVLQKEYEMLIECYLISRKYGYKYWEANALQALSEHFFDKSDRDFLLRNNPVSMGFINTDNMPDTLLSGNLAERSMKIFSDYGDVYQTAGGLRTLAKCYWGIGDNQSALSLLCKALDTEKGKIRQAPDLIASIREQLSIVYSSLNDKRNSDINRNIYLDMQEKTRQDMELDARADQLNATAKELNIMILIIVLFISVLTILMYICISRGKHKNIRSEKLRNSFEEYNRSNEVTVNELKDDIEEEQEEIDIANFNKDRYSNVCIENHAKVFLVSSVKPLIVRIRNEVEKLYFRNEDAETRSSRYAYISELSNKIEEYNTVLTDWIQLRQGDVALHIESFKLQEVFDIVARSKALFALKEIELTVDTTDEIVKADRTLTLFMVNTIADNARKFTPVGGKVEIKATAKDAVVEISIADTGKGMTEAEVANLFNHKVRNGHGFGLLNCKGILNKYKKYSKLFDKCELSVESNLGKGSIFRFQLPKGVMRILLVLLSVAHLSCGECHAQAKENTVQERRINATLDNQLIEKAASYADSAYYSNINNTFQKTLSYADSVYHYLNSYYLLRNPRGKELMKSIGGANEKPAELSWFFSGFNTSYPVILDIRNEAAVAALALHRWDEYGYDNEIYTKLFKEYSADKNLGEYCRIMQRSETNKNIAITILVILFVSLIILVYIIYYRRAVRRHSIEDLYETISTLLSNGHTSEEILREINSLKQQQYYDEINSNISKILEKLSEDSSLTQKLNRRIGELREKKDRLEYENNKLYVSNNILENCLSSIKHETMFYPAIISNKIAEGYSKEQVETLKDVISYYEDLYVSFCDQLQCQIDSTSFQCAPIDISRATSLDNKVVYGNGILLKRLFKILRTENANEPPIFSEISSDNGYLRLGATLFNVAYDEKRHADIFSPAIANIPYLICRQILREIADKTNRCGCGIVIQKTPEGKAMLILTFPLADKTDKTSKNIETI